MAYIKLRHQTYWAYHDIPADVRDTIGRGVRFAESLKTGDKRTAENRKATLEVAWRREIERARRDSPDAVEADAQFWNRALKRAKTDVERHMIEEAIRSDAEEMALRNVDPSDPEWRKKKATDPDANRFFSIAMGEMVALTDHVDAWLLGLDNEPKSKDMKRSSVERFAKSFPYVQDVRRGEVQKWIEGLAAEGLKPRTLGRQLSELRSYWGYLVSREVVPEDSFPFERLRLPKRTRKEVAKEERRAFTPLQVVKLLKAAERQGDASLADLIRLGMWTGARIEELCSLKHEHVARDHFDIVDAKTPAGVREVPIHRSLKPTLQRLKRSGKGGFVLPDLKPNKYGDRSAAIGKRFGRLKTGEGFGEQYVFHSLRHTVTTQFKSEGVSEAIAADLVGHEHKNFTFGTYGDAAYRGALAEAVAKLSYPGYRPK